jgi:hypothetical protein
VTVPAFLLVIVPVAVRVGCGAEHEAKLSAAGLIADDTVMSLFAEVHTRLYVALLEVLAPGLSKTLSCAHPSPATLVDTIPLFTGSCPAVLKFSVCTGPGLPDEYSHW